MYYRNLSRNRAYSLQSEMEKLPGHFNEVNRDVPRRKGSINELSEDEIVFAYNKLRMEGNPIGADASVRNEDLSSEMHKEFQRWLEMKRKNEKSNATVTSNSEKASRDEKVNNIDESENPIEVVDVVKSELDVKAEHEMVSDEVTDVEAATTSDFDEFKDVISDNEEQEQVEEYLKVPLMILEDGDVRSGEEKQLVDDTSLCLEGEQPNDVQSLVPTVIESEASSVNSRTDTIDDVPVLEANTIEAKITLSNTPLEVVTSLSASSISLASDKSCDEAGAKKQKAKHLKGRAPPPPTNVIPGHFYDQVTKKHFRETEL